MADSKFQPLVTLFLILLVKYENGLPSNESRRILPKESKTMLLTVEILNPPCFS